MAGIGGVESDDCHAFLGPCRERGLKRLGRQKRHVAIGHQQLAGEILERRARRGRGMAGAELLVLHHAVGALPGSISAHGLGIGGGHNHDAADACAFQALDHMAQYRQPGHLVQHFGQSRTSSACRRPQRV